eukprot:s69_g30.t1
MLHIQPRWHRPPHLWRHHRHHQTLLAPVPELTGQGHESPRAAFCRELAHGDEDAMFSMAACESTSIFISSLQSAKKSAALADWLRAGAEW